MRVEPYADKSVRRAIFGCLIVAAGIAGIASARAQNTQYDGVYTGTQTLTDSSSIINYSKCLKGPFKRRMVVRNGAVSYVFNRSYQGTVTGTVDADGDVIASGSTTAGSVEFSGSVRSGAFSGEIWSLLCTYAVELKRAP